MGVFLEALNSVMTIILLIAVGYILQVKGKITKEIGNFISFLVVNITLPCGIINTVTTSVDISRIYELPFYVIAIIISQVLSLGAGAVLAKIFKIDEGKKGSFIVLTAFNNTLFMGLPVSIALFGEKSTPIILYYYIASAIMFWTAGVRIIAGKNCGEKIKIPVPIYGAIAGFILLALNTLNGGSVLPSFMTETMVYLSRMTTPLSMIFTGYALGEFGLKNIRFDRNINLGLAARFIVSPLIFMAIIVIAGADEFYRNVFIVQAFMPVMATQTIIARKYGADASYAAVMVTVSTLMSLIIIPLVKTVMVLL